MSKLDGKVAIAGIGEVPTMIYVLLDFADQGETQWRNA